MRTKALLLTAAVAAAGLTTAMAQTVFSVNAVGFVNVTIPAQSFALLANPLDQATNDLATVLPDVPGNNSQVFDFVGGTFAIYTKRSSGAWTGTGAAEARLNPGKGFFLFNAGTTELRLTFIGEVKQGTLTTPIVTGFNLLGSQVPQAGGVETVLGLPPNDNDIAFVLTPTGYAQSTRRSSGAWTGAGEPNLAVAGGFWLQTTAGRNWTRTFSVNQ